MNINTEKSLNHWKDKFYVFIYEFDYITKEAKMDKTKTRKPIIILLAIILIGALGLGLMRTYGAKNREAMARDFLENYWFEEADFEDFKEKFMKDEPEDSAFYNEMEGQFDDYKAHVKKLEEDPSPVSSEVEYLEDFKEEKLGDKYILTTRVEKFYNWPDAGGYEKVSMDAQHENIVFVFEKEGLKNKLVAYGDVSSSNEYLEGLEPEIKGKLIRMSNKVNGFYKN